jgi:hypothetical protein
MAARSTQRLDTARRRPGDAVPRLIAVDGLSLPCRRARRGRTRWPRYRGFPSATRRLDGREGAAELHKLVLFPAGQGKGRGAWWCRTRVRCSVLASGQNSDEWCQPWRVGISPSFDFSPRSDFGSSVLFFTDRRSDLILQFDSLPIGAGKGNTDCFSLL